MFADDTNLIFSNENPESLISNVNSQMEIVSEWFAFNKLSLNIEKTKYILFQPTRLLNLEPALDQIKINEQSIESVSHIKFLSVYIDKCLNWKEHLRIKCNFLSKNLATMCRIRSQISIEMLKLIYNSLIVPHLQYGIVAWGNPNTQDFKRIFMLQKKCIRIVYKSKYNAHTYPIFKKLGLLTIEDIYNINCCKLALKRQRKQLPEYLLSLLPMFETTHNYVTRHSQNIRITHNATTYHQQLLNVKIAKVWNNIPQDIKERSDISIKTHIKTLNRLLLAKYPTNCQIENCYICQNT